MTAIIKAKSVAAAKRSAAAVMRLSDLAGEARRVVLDARRDAGRIVAEAKRKAEAREAEAAERGYAEGFARGQSDGYADGRTRAMAEVDDDLAAESVALRAEARGIVDELLAARERLLHDGRRQLVQFALELAGKIVGRVAATDMAAAESNLAKALELAGFGGELLVQVNPGQLDELSSRCRKMVAALAVPGRVRLVGCETVSPGGVKIATRGGEIDATVETQLANVAEALLGCGSYVPERPARAGAEAHCGGMTGIQ